MTEIERSAIQEAIRLGFWYALHQYGIYRNGTQVIGCMEQDIKNVLQEFDDEKVASKLVDELIRRHRVKQEQPNV